MEDIMRLTSVTWDYLIPFVTKLAQEGKLTKGQPTSEMHRVIVDAMHNAKAHYSGRIFTLAELYLPMLPLFGSIPDYVLADARCVLYGMPCSTEEYEELQKDPVLYAWVSHGWESHYERWYRESNESYLYQWMHNFFRECRAEGIMPMAAYAGVPGDAWHVEIAQWGVLSLYKHVPHRAHKVKAMAWAKRQWTRQGYEWMFYSEDWKKFALCDLPVRTYRRLVSAYVITRDWDLATELAQYSFKECISRAKAYVALTE
jgi:hypothetical protein